MIETEKKYRLSKEVFDKLGEVFKTMFYRECSEENILYTGNNLKASEVLRTRKVSDVWGYRDFVVTYKGKATTNKGIKSRTEIEFKTRERTVLEFIQCLGYLPTLVYEKKRKDFFQEKTIVSLDELPFGYYMEIEGSAEHIGRIEDMLRDRFLIELNTEHLSYPDLTQLYGKLINGVVEARFLPLTTP